MKLNRFTMFTAFVAAALAPVAWAAPTQQAYLKASNTGTGDEFARLAISGDTIVVGATREDSTAIGINGDGSDNSATDVGAAYVFTGFCPSCPQLTLVPDSSGAYVLRFDGVPGLTYRLQRALNVTGPWDTIDTQTTPPSGFIEYHETNPPPAAAFYRTVQP